MRYYAIADLHGRFDLLEKARQAIKEDNSSLSPTEDFKVITLGDYINRGSASKQVISSLMETQKLFDYMICLKGNHEDMAVGGWETLKSYEPDAMPWETGWMDQDHVKWMAGLPLYYETEKHVFIHAGVPEEVNDLDAQDPERQMWMLYGKNDSGGYRGKHVVHGHHQFADGPHVWEGRTDLDTFAWKTGRLVVGVFDDSQTKALRFLEVLGDDYQRAGVE